MVHESRKTKANLRDDIRRLREDNIEVRRNCNNLLEDKELILRALEKKISGKEGIIIVLLWSTIVLFSLLILSLTI
jgi:cell division protein FtsL